MFTSKRLAVSSMPILIALNSKIAMAAEDDYFDFLPPIWPLILILGLIFIFRKQLNCVPPIDLSDPGNEVEPEQEAPDIAKNVPPKTELVNDSINLRDNSKQCQASTAKGTRCKRKNTLEDTTVFIDGIIYQLCVCAQHNNDTLKPYPGLIK